MEKNPFIQMAVEPLNEYLQAGQLDPGRYIQRYVVPSLALFVLMLILFIFAPLPLFSRIAILILGVIALVGAIAYPKIRKNRIHTSMSNNFQLFVTHITSLSASNINRVEIFNQMATEDEYGELQKESERILRSVDVWNQSLDEAVGRRAKTVSYPPVNDLFERMSYVLEAGQDIEDFLIEEQESIITEYEEEYKQSLEDVKVTRELYLSLIVSMSFGLVFTLILPIVSGNNPIIFTGVAVIFFIFTQMGFYVFVSSLIPYDPIWYQKKDPRNNRAQKLRLYTVGASLVSLILLIVAGLLIFSGISIVPIEIYVPITTLPLFIVGLLYRYEQRRIGKKDEQFASTIRTLGATESIKQSTTVQVLETLKEKDLGKLSEDIESLYKRLEMNIDTGESWNEFSRESNSYLIDRFSKMYTQGRELGADTKKLGEILGGNMDTILQLRQKRYKEIVSLIGIIYGLTIASVFALFAGVEITQIIANFETGASDTEVVGGLVNSSQYDFGIIQILLFIVIIFNAVISSLIIRKSQGSHIGICLFHGPLLLWVSSIVVLVTRIAIGSLLSVNVG